MPISNCFSDAGTVAHLRQCRVNLSPNSVGVWYEKISVEIAWASPGKGRAVPKELGRRRGRPDLTLVSCHTMVLVPQRLSILLDIRQSLIEAHAGTPHSVI